MSWRAGPTAALLLVCTVALVLRLIGLQFGLPAVYNPDEIAIMSRALSFGKGSLNPHNFLYPTFYFYVLFAWVGAYLAWLWLIGRVSFAALPAQFFTNPTGIYTAGRALGAMAGTASVLLVYRLTARLMDGRAALAAAVFLAVAPLHVRDSHYVKHDVFATMTVIVAYLAIVRVWPATRETGLRRHDVIVAGAACGVALSTHYYCIFLALPLAFSVVQATRPRGAAAAFTHLLWSVGAMLAAFLALSPFLALEPFTAWRDIVANREIVVDRAVTTGAFSPALRYLELLVRDSLGLPVVLLGLTGALCLCVTQPARATLLLAFPVPFLVFISNTVPASRYLNPVLPFLAMFAGWVLSALASRFRAPNAVFWLAVIACALPGALESIRAGLFFRQTDTRTLAQAYIEQHVPPGTTMAVQPYSVSLTQSRDGLAEALTRNLGSADATSAKFQLQLSLEPYPAPAYRLIYLGSGGLDADKIYVEYEKLGHGLAPLRQLGVAFVVVKRYNDEDLATTRFLAALARAGRRIAVFSPYRADVDRAGQALVEPFLHNTDRMIVDGLERPGPPLEIWQLDEPGS